MSGYYPDEIFIVRTQRLGSHGLTPDPKKPAEVVELVDTLS